MNRFSTLAIALTVASGSTECHSQTVIPGLVPGTVYAITDPMTFDEAKQFAIGRGGHLVVFDTAGEDAWVRNGFALTGGSWIGLQRPPGSAPWTWSWVNGLGLDQTHCATCPIATPPWSAGEPNNFMGRGETAVEMRPDGQWNDLAPTDRKPAILELFDPGSLLPSTFAVGSRSASMSVTGAATASGSTFGPSQLGSANFTSAGSIAAELTTAGDTVLDVQYLSSSRIEMSDFGGSAPAMPSGPFGPQPMNISVSGLVLQFESDQLTVNANSVFVGAGILTVVAGTVTLTGGTTGGVAAIGDLAGNSQPMIVTGRILRRGDAFEVTLANLAWSLSATPTDFFGQPMPTTLDFSGSTLVANELIPAVDRAAGKSYQTLFTGTAEAAQRWAQQAGGELVSFDTLGEQQWVQTNVRTVATKDHHIGLNRAVGPSPWSWTWSSGMTLAQTHCASCPTTVAPWAAGQPDNAGPGEETRVVFAPATGTWSDVATTTMAPAILELPGFYRTYARGCGIGIPALNAARLPAIGESLSLALSGLPTSAPCTLFFRFGSAGVPIVLNSIGMTGCVLRAAPQASIPGTASAIGEHEFVFTLPNDPGLVGLEFHNQGAYVEPAANALGVGLTNAGEGIIGG